MNLDHRLAEGMSWHFAIMWLLAINGICYVTYTFVSGEWRHLLPNRKSFRDAWMVILHDLHLSKVSHRSANSTVHSSSPTRVLC